jgi:hypothetical protein
LFDWLKGHSRARKTYHRKNRKRKKKFVVEKV